MAEHKMVSIDGIRYRPEDIARARARQAARGPLTVAHAEPVEDPFDPSEHDVPGVLAYLAEADEDETSRVLAAEAAGKARKTITEAGA